MAWTGDRGDRGERGERTAKGFGRREGAVDGRCWAPGWMGELIELIGIFLWLKQVKTIPE